MVEYTDVVNTGIAWLPQIPQHWEVRKLKYAFDERSDKGYPNEPLLVSSQNMGVVLKSVYGKRTVEALKDLDKLKLVKVGDYVVSLRSFQGGIEYAYYQGIISPAYTIMEPHKDCKSDYYKFLFKSAPFIKLLTTCVTGIREGQNVDYKKLRNVEIPIPPRAEQDQIVRFLDWKVSKIKKLISIRRKEIQELEELKAHAIDKIVIHGLHGSAETQNNDIRWDIDYPSTWKLERLRNLFTFRKGLSITKANLEPTGILVISYGQVHSKKNSMVGLNNELFRYVNSSYLKTDPSALVQKGDFIFADTSEDLDGSGNCAYVDRSDKIFAGYHTVIAHPKEGTDNKYFAYLFKSPTWRYQIRKKVNAVKVYSITQQLLKDVFLLVPPQDEQQEIVRYLDSTCVKIDSLIESTHKKIAELTEMKSVIISDVVTGKIDVCNVTIPEYEHIDNIYDDNNEDGEETDETETDGEEA